MFYQFVLFSIILFLIYISFVFYQNNQVYYKAKTMADDYENRLNNWIDESENIRNGWQMVKLKNKETEDINWKREGF